MVSFLTGISWILTSQWCYLDWLLINAQTGTINAKLINFEIEFKDSIKLQLGLYSKFKCILFTDMIHLYI